MSRSVQIKKVNWWHERFSDWLIANPSKTLGEAAKEFGVTLPWLSSVKNSDAFVDFHAERSLAHSKAVSLTIAEKTRAVAEMALDAVGERLEKEATTLPFDTLLETADTMLKRAGYGEAPRSGSPVQVNVGLVTRGELDALRSRMREPAKVIELQASTPPAKQGAEGA